MNEKPQERIETDYKEIKTVYKKKGPFYSFYTLYWNLTCHYTCIFQMISEGKNYNDVGLTLTRHP